MKTDITTRKIWEMILREIDDRFHWLNARQSKELVYSNDNIRDAVDNDAR